MSEKLIHEKESGPKAFGHPGRYYSLDQPTFIREDQQRRSSLEQKFAEMLGLQDKDLPQRVERVFKQWNGILRDYLRSETGLRLTVGEETQAVPVRVKDGLPKPLAEILGRFDEKIWGLLLNRAALERAEPGLRFVQDEFEWISTLEQISQRSSASREEVQNTAILVKSLLEEIEKQEVLKQIKGIHQDVLGAYFFWVPEVHLYWMVIAFMAGVIGVTVEALTVVVTIHELAHAYTHLGRDIDGKRWGTQDFAKADSGIVEGLAQFYTASICRKLQQRFPSAWEAYESLLKHQSGPYCVHEPWIKDTAAGEVLRITMIACRSNGITKLVEFESAREQHRKELRKKLS